MNPTPVVWTVGKLLEWTELHFRSAGKESARLDAQVLLAHALQCRRPELYTRYDSEPDDAARTRFRELVRARAAGTPVAYLVGSKEFFLLDFRVSPAVLIPRPATETLVTTALDRLKNRTEARVLEIGTGSGCVIISLLHRLGQVRAVATDCSEIALAVARENARRHGVDGRLEFRIGDGFDAAGDLEPFDIILSNPPYIPTGEISGLMPEVRDHEPKLALDGGTDGLAVIRKLVEGSPQRLLPGGALLIEVGQGQADTVIEIMRTAGFTTIEAIRDFERIARVVAGRRA